MKERPILFSAPMVRAILDGSKTQTRRIFKQARGLSLSVDCSEQGLAELSWLSGPGPGYEVDETIKRIQCPHGQPGDRLYVRETWAQPTTLDPGPTVYRADYPACVPAGFENIPPADQIQWKPSIHMPRALSRINLEITGVRVERLQDISEADAKAEGITPHEVRQMWLLGATAEERAAIYRRAAVAPYQELWESINGAGSWKANPWVWVVEFQRAR